MTTLAALLFLPMVLCLKISELSVPDLVDVLGSATLICKFELQTTDHLYSVKWYKDDLEFFRYMPSTEPSVSYFSVHGVHLVKDKCNETVVVLDQLEYNTSGTYKCEVSGEAPHFKTYFTQSNMTVLGLPKEDPWIQGVLHSYAIGEYVNVNCTSSPSYPPAKLTWLINLEKAERWLTSEYPPPKTRHYLGLESRSLGLRFQVDNSHFPKRDGILELTCSADVLGLTRRRVTKSEIARLTNEKYAQEHLLNSQGLHIPNWKHLLCACGILVHWTFFLT